MARPNPKEGKTLPVVSQKQNAAMHAAAQGQSSLGIPASVGREFVDASQGEKVSELPEYVQAQKGHRSKTRRGRKKAKAHHADAKVHLQNAIQAKTPQGSTAHLFKALSSLNKAKQATPTDGDGDEPQGTY